MKYIYFAQFYPASDKPGAWCVDFPDLPGCFTEGENLADAVFNARECLELNIESILDDPEEVLPPPSGPELARQKAEAHCQELGFPIVPGIFYQAVEANIIKEKPVAICVSMRPSLLAQIDRTAKEEGMTRSGFLAVASQRYLKDLQA